ncbi:type II toxin-antitoxin system VapC family toxin [Nonomuraea harbinensis]|uniref:Type II toxin-antitoxin system VapC family toxin n=1 Tax=Nonomuraea harbinensis TaxID=1286938 RepID=A0ABW1BLN1_9ACTN|nr:type II toxin-antitoxin system VapC family toxin [Nonomuraea harbinensis]
MIIDSSAIIAVINGEPEAIPFAHTIAANVCRISAVNYVEAAIVADNRGEAMRNAFDTLVDEMGLISLMAPALLMLLISCRTAGSPPRTAHPSLQRHAAQDHRSAVFVTIPGARP